MNITDMDDKTIKGSEKSGLSLSEFTGRHIESFMEDLKTLNINSANKYPRVSEHLEDMSSLAKKLVDKGFAYEKLRSIYFDISRYSDYGRLSGIDLDKIRLGATVDLDEYEKDNPRDFTLLKRSRLSELKRGIYVKTEWGNVRPSWHLQCAAISMKYLGESFDIHTSSRELLFPHHENEMAIAWAATGKPLAKYWMHCDRVMVDGKKIDEIRARKTLSDLNDMGYSGRVIRYWLIASHYRKPITFSTDMLDSAENSLKRLDSCIHDLLGIKDGDPYPELDQLLYDIKHGFISAMDDDLNISVAMASIFKIVKQINTLVLKKMIDPPGVSKIIDAFKNIDSVLKILDFNSSSYDSEIESLINQRNQARLEKNWDLADKIRNQLAKRGIITKDRRVI